MKQARAMCQEEWSRRVETLEPLELRTKVARIVWNDMFADYPAILPTTLFDAYVRKLAPIDLPVEAVFNGLVAVGYPEKFAMERASEDGRMECAAVPKEGAGVATRTPGYHSLMCDVLTLAILDCKMLVSKGVIVDGKVSPTWSPKASYGYTSYANVKEVNCLIEFLTSSGLQGLFYDVGLGVDVEVVLNKLGLKSQPKKSQPKKLQPKKIKRKVA
jgi:hypothetical protein